MTRKTAIIGFLFILLSVSKATAQVGVLLRLDTSRPSSVSHELFCDARFNCGLLSHESQKDDTFGDGSTPIRVERSGDNFLVYVNANGRRGLTNEKPVHLVSGGKAIVSVKKQVAPKTFLSLPYEISHERENDKGNIVDSFSIRPNYLVLGTFRYGRCSLDFALNDMNADGKIDLLDGGRGTNIQIDRNADGKFWGKGEFSSTNEIIEMCSRNYLVQSLSYRRIIFSPTSLKLAKVREKVPDFSFVLLNGSKVSSDLLKGRPYVLDFWASWCAPCVKNLASVKKLRDDLRGSVEVLSVNVDKASRKALAEQIIRANQLSEFVSIRGLGDRDRLWKVFGGANLNRLAIPLYALIDRDGIVRYVGNGGDQLSELKAAINSAP